MKQFFKSILFIAAAVFATAACNKQDDLFQRDVDAFSVDCNAQDVTHYVLVNGSWRLETSEDWISFDPAEGSGDGVFFQPYKIVIAYNSGDAREGVYSLVHGGKRLDVTVSQGACNFKFGTVSFAGKLTRDVESAASVVVAYSGAAGNESVSYSGTISGAGAAGLSIAAGTYDIRKAGAGEIVIPVIGTPTAEGEITIDVTVNGKAVGSAKAEVTAPVVVPPDEPKPLSGFPVGWNFYAEGVTPGGSDYDYSWSFGQSGNDNDSKNPVGSAQPSTAHRVLPTVVGNEGAYFTCVGGAVTAYVFNPSIQAKGLVEGDYWMAVIPCTGVKTSNMISVEAGVGSAGSSVGFYLLEYSLNGSDWTTVDGAADCTRGTDTFKAHYWNTQLSITSATRKSYDKATDDTYHKYSFSLTEGIPDGTLFLRLRVLKYRATPDSTDGVAPNTWTDVKGFEVSIQ